MIQGNGESQEEGNEPASNQNVLADIWELARLPALLAILAMLLTWAVWYNTTEPSQPDSAKPAGCSWNRWEKCISLEVLNKMFTHGAIAGGAGGVSYYIMLRRERLAREAAERRAADAESRLDAERRQADAERRQADEERRQADAERQRLIDRILELSDPSRNGQGQADSESE